MERRFQNVFQLAIWPTVYRVSNSQCPMGPKKIQLFRYGRMSSWSSCWWKLFTKRFNNILSSGAVEASTASPKGIKDSPLPPKVKEPFHTEGLIRTTQVMTNTITPTEKKSPCWFFGAVQNYRCPYCWCCCCRFCSSTSHSRFTKTRDSPWNQILLYSPPKRRL